MARPDYCPCENDAPDPCPECGATIRGDDPVHGVCQALHNGPRPHPLVELILTDKVTGARIR